MLSSAILTTQLNIKLVQLGANYCAYPPKDEQKAIGAFLDQKMDESRKVSEGINDQITTLTAYRKSLIHECVTGKRRISEEDVATFQAHG
jgi:type I restriction enzyme S subunit